MPKILSSDTHPTNNPVKKTWKAWKGIDKFYRLSLVSMLLLIIATPIIVHNSFDTRQRAAGNTYYVAPNGNDANDGSITSPFRTVQKAVWTVPEGSTIQLRAGVYNESIYIGKNNLTVEGYPGERAIIDESMDVTGWTPVGNNVYKTSFTRAPNPGNRSWPGASAMYTCPNGDPSSGDRNAYLLVDDTYDTDHWLRPLCDGYKALNGQYDFQGLTNLPAGGFYTDVTAGYDGDWGGKTSNIWIHLKDNSNPNNHRVRIGKYDDYFYFENSASGITIRNLTMQMAAGHAFYMDGADNYITLDHNEIRLTKYWTAYGRRYGSNWTIKNNWMHSNEYENVHMEADNALIENNLMEDTITPWTKWGDAGVNAIGNNIIVRYNTVRHMLKSTDPDRCATYCGGGGGIGNEVFGGWNNALNHKFYNNLIYDNPGNAMSLVSDGSEAYNNVMYNNCGGLGAGWNPDTSRNNTAHNNNIHNNTIYNNNRANCYARSAGIEMARETDGNQIHHNVVYGNSSDYYNGGTNNNLYSNVSSEQPGYGADRSQQIGSNIDPATFWNGALLPSTGPTVPVASPIPIEPTPTLPPTGTTLGKTTIGATMDANAAPLYMNGSKFQMGATGKTTTSLSVYMTNIQSGTQYQMSIYTDINGTPGNLVASSTVGTLTTNGWNTLHLSTNLQAGVTYWIMVVHTGANNTVNKIYYDTSSTQNSAYSTAPITFGTFPSTLAGGTATENKVYSLYASFNQTSITPTPIISTATGSKITIYAAGTASTGIYPVMQLMINGTVVQTWNSVQGDPSSRTFQQFSYTSPTNVSANQIKITYTNDDVNITSSQDRNLSVDKIIVNGVDYQSEASDTYSVGIWNGTDCAGGYRLGETLYCNGYFAYNTTSSPTPTRIPTPTATLTPTPYPSATPTPTAGKLVVFSPLTFNTTTIRRGDTLTGTVSYKNVGGSPVSIQDVIIATRPPGGTNSGGPFYDLSPKLGATTVVPGQIINLSASRVIGSSDPTGNWYGFSTYHTSSGQAVDDPTAVSFAVTNATGTGLVGRYYTNTNLSGTPLTRVDGPVSFSWYWGSPLSGIGSNLFSVRWTGFFVPKYSQTYTISFTADDGVRLWVDNKLLINKWLTQSAKEYSAKITLVAGQSYPIRIDYYENTGLATAQLRWQSASQAKQIIPIENLYPN